MEIVENRDILLKKEYPVVKLTGMSDCPDIYLIGDLGNLSKNILRDFFKNNRKYRLQTG